MSSSVAVAFWVLLPLISLFFLSVAVAVAVAIVAVVAVLAVLAAVAVKHNDQKFSKLLELLGDPHSIFVLLFWSIWYGSCFLVLFLQLS